MALLLTATAASAASAATPSLRSGVCLAPPRRLKNPFMALSDDLDSASEETKAPHQLKGMLYVALLPWLGLGICLLGFPVLWWNERRATGRRKAPAAPAAPAAAAGTSTVKGTPTNEEAKGEATVQGQAVGASGASEGQSLLHPEKAYESAVESFEERHCGYRCCRMVKSCFEQMPELEGTGDARTVCFRLLGTMMIFVGVDMMLSPTYFLLHSLWFFGFIIAGHLALCVCKFSCLSSCCTMLTSYLIHRPALMALLGFSVLSVTGLSLYYNVPVHGAAR